MFFRSLHIHVHHNSGQTQPPVSDPFCKHSSWGNSSYTLLGCILTVFHADSQHESQFQICHDIGSNMCNSIHYPPASICKRSDIRVEIQCNLRLVCISSSFHDMASAFMAALALRMHAYILSAECFHFQFQRQRRESFSWRVALRSPDCNDGCGAKVYWAENPFHIQTLPIHTICP